VDEMMHLRELADRRERSRNFRRIIDDLWPDGYPASVIQVVGTNGKGTVVKMCELALVAQGIAAGALTSPHVVDVRERWSINGAPVADSDLARAWQRALGALDERSVTFGFHDLCVLVGLIVCAEAGVSWVIIEAGIGGAYDRTTAIDREAVVLTNVGADHLHVLGPLHWQRLLNKSRAAVAQRPFISGIELPGDLFDGPGTPSEIRVVPAASGQPARSHAQALALAVLDSVGLLPSADAHAVAADAMSRVQLVGRWQWLDRLTVVDMAHNRDAVGHLVERLLTHAEDWRSGAWTAVVSIGRHRDPVDVFEPLLPHCAHVLCVQSSADGLEAAELASRLAGSSAATKSSIQPLSEVEECLGAARRLGRPTVACGSSRLVGRLVAPADPRLRDLDLTYGWRGARRGATHSPGPTPIGPSDKGARG
jgi:dihydrofolate synthase/folylpolyglutamate synthase